MPHDPRWAKVRETEHYLLDWLHRFKSYNKGIHIGFGTPSRAPQIFLDAFQTTLAFKTTSYEDVHVICNSLQFLPDRLVHSRERHDNYQIEFLKTQPSDMFILKRVDIPNAFPVRMIQPDLTRTHIGEENELQERIRLFFPAWETPQVVSRVALERYSHDVTNRKKDVLEEAILNFYSFLLQNNTSDEKVFCRTDSESGWKETN